MGPSTAVVELNDPVVFDNKIFPVLTALTTPITEPCLTMSPTLIPETDELTDNFAKS